MCPVGGDDGNVNELTIAASPIGDDDREDVIQLTAVVFTVDDGGDFRTLVMMLEKMAKNVPQQSPLLVMMVEKMLKKSARSTCHQLPNGSALVWLQKPFAKLVSGLPSTASCAPAP